MRMIGVVKWFNPLKGYGFIEGRDGKDYFLHKNELQRSNIQHVDTGYKVEFESVNGKKGMQAEKIDLMI